MLVGECRDDLRGPVAVVRVHVGEGHVGLERLPLHRLESAALEVADLRQSFRSMAPPPVVLMKAQGEETSADGGEVQRVLLAEAGLRAAPCRRAQRAREIDQMVPDVPPSALLHVHVEGVLLLHVPVIEPRAEHAQRAKLAAVLVAQIVVGVVPADALVAEGTERRSVEEAARDREPLPVGEAVHASENRIQVRLRHGPLHTARVADRGLPGDGKAVAREAHDAVVRHVVSGRVEDPACDGRGGARCPQLARRIELDEVDVPLPVPDIEPGRHALGLGPDHGPRPFCRRTFTVSGSEPHALRGEREEADPVGEPRGVGHFAQRVHVGCVVDDLTAEERPDPATETHRVHEASDRTQEGLVRRGPDGVRIARRRRGRDVAAIVLLPENSFAKGCAIGTRRGRGENDRAGERAGSRMEPPPGRGPHVSSEPRHERSPHTGLP